MGKDNIAWNFLTNTNNYTIGHKFKKGSIILQVQAVLRERIITTSGTTSKTIDFESGENLMVCYNNNNGQSEYMFGLDEVKNGLGNTRVNYFVESMCSVAGSSCAL